MHTNLIKPALLAVLMIVFLAACGGDSDSEDAFVETFDTYLTSFSFDYNPAAHPADLADRSTVVTKATLVDVEDGRYFGSEEGKPEGVHLNLVMEDPDGTRYYVQIPRPMDSDVNVLREVLPIGAESVVFLMPNTDPLSDGWFNTRDDGNEWFFTTPQGWILDHPERGVMWPLENADHRHVHDDHDHDKDNETGGTVVEIHSPFLGADETLPLDGWLLLAGETP